MSEGSVSFGLMGTTPSNMDLGVSGRLRQCCVARTAPVRAEAANLSDMLVRAKYRSTHDLP